MGGEEEEGHQKEFPKGFKYDTTHEEMQKSLVPFEMSPQYINLHASFGFDCLKMYNIHYIEYGVILYSTGNTVQTLDLFSGKKTVIFGRGQMAGSSVGAVDVHPSKNYFAVAEISSTPNVYIYEYPSLDCIRILRNGTENGYSCVKFNPKGDKLASVGKAPDFLLTIWDWQHESVVLRAKAFGQDVYRVEFSKFNDGLLYSSGTGHIRFWKMASTFTGLKLQGQIGKFGQVELSDIDAFAELPDFRVVSGTEAGNLLMWDGNFIQFTIALPGGKKCHENQVEVVIYEDGDIISAGRDGYVKIWEFKKFEFVEVDEDYPVFELEPKQEIFVGEGVEIVGMLRGEDHWILQDAKGGLFKLWVPSYDVERLISTHAGTISGIEVNPFNHTAITCGTDGSVRGWNVLKEKFLCSMSFKAAAKCMSMVPPNVDPLCNTVVVGFADGCVRMLVRKGEAFQLLNVVKPHKDSCEHIAVAPDGSMYASCDSTGQLFFFKYDFASAKFVPLVFIELPSRPSNLVWSIDGLKLLLSCGKEILEVSKPDPSNYDDIASRETFKGELEIASLTPKISLLREIEVEVPQEPEEGSDETPPPLIEIETVEEEYEDDISTITYSNNPGEVIITLKHPKDDLEDQLLRDRYEAVYFVNFSEAIPKPKKVVPLGDGFGEVTSLRLSRSAKYLALGTNTGAVQLRSLDDPSFFFSTLAHQACDFTAGITTFDDRMLATIGGDGNFFTFNIEPETALAQMEKASSKKLWQIRGLREKERTFQAARELQFKERTEAYEEALAKGVKERDMPEPPRPLENVVSQINPLEEEKLKEGLKFLSADVLVAAPVAEPLEEKTPTADEIENVEDISDGATYSIEDAKQKQEEDEKMSAAEKKKQIVRMELQEMRQEFQFLLKKNDSLEPAQRLPREAFELDPKLRAQLEAETQEKIDTLRKELAWVSEKHDLALKKLKNKFLDKLIVEHISMKSFKTGIIVSSFRTPELPPFLRDAIQQVHEMIESDEKSRKEKEAANKMASSQGGNTDDNDDGGGDKSGPSGRKSVSKSSTKATGKSKVKGSKTHVGEAEIRKQARTERKKQLEKLKASKPDKSVDDPMDVAAVQYAEKNMGDYKLKSNPNYVVPEHQRVNAERKRRQMVLLQESVHFIKMGFNERFLAMRDLKSRIIKNIKKDNLRLRELNRRLDLKDPLYEPEIDQNEWPETREEFSPEELKKFSDISTAKGKKEESKEGDAEGVELTPDITEEGRSEEEAKLLAMHDMRLSGIPKSDMEAAEQTINSMLLEHERRTLLEKIDFAVWTFDQALAKLRREKFKLDTDLKTTDLKVITLYHELQLLHDFEESENRLFNKLAKARGSKVEVVQDKTDCEKQLNMKLAEIKAWQEKDKQVMADFNQVVGGEKSEFYPQLLKIFKKKVKRKKNKARNDEDGSDEENSDMSDSDSDDDDSDDESDEDDDESCPQNCDSAIYEKVLELREKRLEQEEILAEFEKAVDELNKMYDRHKSREKSIDKDLANTEVEIEAFQCEKQRALNQIEVTIPLKLSQIKYLEGKKLPTDISDALIFTSTGLQKLRNRIVELGDEKVQLAKQYKDLKRGHKILLKELQIKRDQIAVEQKKCEDVQMLKFGQIIDLSILAKVGVDEGAVELRRKLQNLEKTSVRKLNEWDHKISEAKDQLAAITKQNTQWLEKVVSLTKAQYDLEDQLNNTTKDVHVTDKSGTDEKGNLERRQLLQLVHIQEKEVDALKAEIHVLRRKGGHVYTPAQ